MHVASFGSVNLDLVVRLTDARLAALTDRYDWVPDAGETVRVGALPDDVESLAEEVLLGGKGANQAVAAARAGSETTLYGKVGTDQSAHGVLDSLSADGVDVSAVAVEGERTGTAVVFVAPDGENRIAIVPGANGLVTPAYAHAQLDQLRSTDVLLVQNELPTATLDALLLALDGQATRPTVVFDPAPVDGSAALLAHPCIDYVTPNEAEYTALADTLRAWSGTVVRTRGEQPVVVDGPDGSFECHVPPVAPVDTTGAGDVFTGYLAAELACGTPLRSAVDWAVSAASLSTERPGAQPGIPDRAAVTSFRDGQQSD